MKILVTGANGYIGTHLIPCLLDAGHEVVCMVRDPRRFRYSAKGLELVRADLLDADSLERLPRDCDVAFYLVHSMGASSDDFPELERRCASHFSRFARASQLKQVIYLSGIANEGRLSRHLGSRLEVERILAACPVPLTVLRSAIIIGSGSASFEILRDLVEKLPVMITPRWIGTRCQPIGIKDLVFYLVSVIGREETYGKSFDVGGPDVLSYKEMMQIYAEVRGLRRTIIDVPVFSPRLSSYWLYFLTSTNYALARSLVASMKTEVTCGPQTLDDIVAHQPISYREALKRALARIENNQVLASWKDAVVSGQVRDDYLDFVHIPENGVFRDVQEIPAEVPVRELRRRIYGIGGERGWYYMSWAWRFRGFLDKLVGGVGLRRGRRDPDDLRVGDALDFWRVLVTASDRHRLTLFAEMKVPGEAWLEYEIRHEGRKPVLVQTATFRPRGLFGRLYWYALVPIHFFIFSGMARAIAAGKTKKRSSYPSGGRLKSADKLRDSPAWGPLQTADRPLGPT